MFNLDRWAAAVAKDNGVDPVQMKARAARKAPKQAHKGAEGGTKEAKTRILQL